ncbi:MAG TPA: S1/P1 nuclease [Sphingomonadaceae bacterium]|nr:S1/P1 nuclease [Sphingomonadaceae bacterium]
MRILLPLVALLLAPAPAKAWWEYGHYTVANIAEARVAPATGRQIAALLRQGRSLDTPTCSVKTLALAAYWPDCVRRLDDRFSYSFPWHYQNVDICKPFDLKSACRDGNCVSAQIDRQVRLLKDKALPTRERLQALAFLTHFVGDLHMPLHAGDRGDRGGNDVKVAYGLIEGRANLHSVWDGWIAERGITEPPGGPDALLDQVVDHAAASAGTVDDWSREGWQVSRDVAYATALGGDPCGPKPEGRVRLDEAKIRLLLPAVRLQIARGGLRLARLLDEAFAPA